MRFADILPFINHFQPKYKLACHSSISRWKEHVKHSFVVSKVMKRVYVWREQSKQKAFCLTLQSWVMKQLWSLKSVAEITSLPICSKVQTDCRAVFESLIIQQPLLCTSAKFDPLYLTVVSNLFHSRRLLSTLFCENRQRNNLWFIWKMSIFKWTSPFSFLFKTSSLRALTSAFLTVFLQVPFVREAWVQSLMKSIQKYSIILGH